MSRKKILTLGNGTRHYVQAIKLPTCGNALRSVCGSKLLNDRQLVMTSLNVSSLSAVSLPFLTKKNIISVRETCGQSNKLLESIY